MLFNFYYPLFIEKSESSAISNIFITQIEVSFHIFIIDNLTKVYISNNLLNS